MAVNSDAVGRAYPPVVYAVGREKIVEFAHATGETAPVHLDVTAARAAGYADVVAPPMFAVVYQWRGVGHPLTDPDLAIDFTRLLHAGQEFRWGPVVVAGDEVTTTISVAAVREGAGMQFFDFAAESVNQRGETVAHGLWKNVVRGPEGS